MKLIAFVSLLLVLVSAGITSSVATLSSKLTLVSSVQYNFAFTFESDTIPAGATATFDVSTNYILSSVSNCVGKTSSGGTFSTIPTCTVTSTGSGYTISLSGGIFTAQINSLTHLELQVMIH